MSFNIKIQYTSSEKKQLDKSIKDIVELSGALKSETSIVNPTILIQGNVSDLRDANYMSIPQFGRKYFITEIVSVRQNLIEVSGHCDVLTTYKEAIRKNSAIVRKQENKWNLYLNDGTFKTYQNPMVLTKKFPKGLTKDEFVMCVAGD